MLASDIVAGLKWRIRAGRYKMQKRLEHSREWCAGRVIEMRGNSVTIDGCRFDVSAPAISTRVKSNFLFDTYERPEREAIRRFLDPDVPVIELGGSIGVVSCLVNKKLANPARHVVVEANPAIAKVLERNRALNGCQFSILNRVVAYGAEEVVFYANSTCFLGSSTILHPEAARVESIEQIKIKATSLRELADTHGFDRFMLICDIEGAEAGLVEHEADVLRRRVAILMLEVHPFFLGTENADRIVARIESLGFVQRYHEGDTYVFERVSAAAEGPRRQ